MNDYYQENSCISIRGKHHIALLFVVLTIHKEIYYFYGTEVHITKRVYYYKKKQYFS